MDIVHVFNYEHRYGVDTGVYATRGLALKNAAFIMLEWLDDFRESGSEQDCMLLLHAIKSCSYEEALTLWNQTMEDETMRIEEYIVSPPSEDAVISKTLADMLAEAEGQQAQEVSEV